MSWEPLLFSGLDSRDWHVGDEHWNVGDPKTYCICIMCVAWVCILASSPKAGLDFCNTVALHMLQVLRIPGGIRDLNVGGFWPGLHRHFWNRKWALKTCQKKRLRRLRRPAFTSHVRTYMNIHEYIGPIRPITGYRGNCHFQFKCFAGFHDPLPDSDSWRRQRCFCRAVRGYQFFKGGRFCSRMFLCFWFLKACCAAFLRRFVVFQLRESSWRRRQNQVEANPRTEQ